MSWWVAGQNGHLSHPSLQAHCWISASVASPRGDLPRRWPQSHLHLLQSLLLLLSDVPSVTHPPLSSLGFSSFRSHPTSSHGKLPPGETWFCLHSSGISASWGYPSGIWGYPQPLQGCLSSGICLLLSRFSFERGAQPSWLGIGLQSQGTLRSLKAPFWLRCKHLRMRHVGVGTVKSSCRHRGLRVVSCLHPALPTPSAGGGDTLQLVVMDVGPANTSPMRRAAPHSSRSGLQRC